MSSLMMWSTLYRASALVAFSFVLSAAPLAVAQETVLYDIDFSAPTHTLNAKPTVGEEPDKVSRINFGSPTVVSSFGELTDRPLLFTGNGNPYDQIKLNGNSEIETCRLEFDVLTEGVKGSGFEFTILFDTPSVRTFSLSGSTNTIEGTTRTWEEGHRSHCSLVADFKNNRWEARMDGALVFSVPINATELRSIRFSLGPRSLTSPPNPNVKVAVDDIRVVVTNRLIPDAPAELSATGGTGVNAISLSWSGIPEAESYQIYRSTLPSSATATLIAETANQEYADSNVSLRVTYNYWIKSVVTGTNTSVFGPRASAAIDLGPPTYLTVSGQMDGILLSWKAPPRATSHRIYRSRSDSFTSATLLATTTSQTYFDAATLPGARYFYWVDSGSSSVFSRDMAYGYDVRRLEPVTGFEASSHLFSNRIDLRWDPAPGATQYGIYRGETAEFQDARFLSYASNTAYQDLRVANDLGYHYWVLPISRDTWGPISTPATGVASLFQPDLWLEAASEKEFGRGIVQGSENPSILTERGRNRSPITAKLWVGKIGVRDGRVTVEGSPGNADFGVNYYREGNVTSEVLTSRLQIDSEDGKGPVQISIQPSRRIQNLPGERVYTLVCRGVPVDFTTAEDQVQMDALSLPKRLRKPVRKPVRKPQVPAWTRPSIEDRAN